MMMRGLRRKGVWCYRVYEEFRAGSILIQLAHNSLVLKYFNKHHRVREAIAAKILQFAHISSEKNLADILTKPLGNQRFYELVKPHLFRVPLHIKEEK